MILGRALNRTPRGLFDGNRKSVETNVHNSELVAAANVELPYGIFFCSFNSFVKFYGGCN